MKNDIMKILRWRRRAHSNTLEQFVKHYMGQWDLKKDKYGNLYTRVGTAPILWSCHLDTVHHKEGWQNVRIDSDGYIKQKGRKSRCLGADDGAGIWLLLEMLNHRKEGLYVFHLDEEVGGKGSDWITTWNEKLVDGIKFAVAFDRKSTHSIITSQYGVCCSDTFGDSLSKELGMGHVLDTTGRFTDTDNYKELIPECTNVSVGYYNEHTPDEKLNWVYLQELRDAVLKVDVSKLVVERDPNKFTYSYRNNRRNSGSYNYGYNYNYGYEGGYWEQYNDGIREAQQEARRLETSQEKAITKTSSFSATREKCTMCGVVVSKVSGLYIGTKFFCSYSCSNKTLEEKPEPVVRKVCPGMGTEVTLKDSTKTNIENIERLCSLNSRKLARLFLDMGATYEDVLHGFLDLDMSKTNVAREDSNKDGWLSMIAKFVLGGK